MSELEDNGCAGLEDCTDCKGPVTDFPIDLSSQLPDVNGSSNEQNNSVTGIEEGDPILEPNEHDVLNGRGASVNAHRGNKHFRALCFSRKPEFEAGNHAAKRRIAAEIVAITRSLPGRFLKRVNEKSPWYEVSKEKAILKACQVMRDFQRPDRLAIREMALANGARKRQRTSESTPGINAPIINVPLPPIVENPYGVHDHDVLSGRGAFVNGHVGNERFRCLAIDRKPLFDAGNYTEKRALATEMVNIIRNLNPPGRFLKRINNSDPFIASSDHDSLSLHASRLDGEWEELSDERAIHKACQVMRDLNRPDRAPEKKTNSRKKKNQDFISLNVKVDSGETISHDVGIDVSEESMLGSEDTLAKVLEETMPVTVDHQLVDVEEKPQLDLMRVSV